MGLLVYRHLTQGVRFVILFALALAWFSCAGPDAEDGPDAASGAELSEEQLRMRELNDALAADPEDAELLARRGAVFYESKVYDKAIADLRASIQLDSSRWEVWHMLADAQIDGLRSREALNTMIFAASEFPDRMGTLLKLSEFQYILRRYDDALATLDRAARLDSKDGEVFFMIGQVLAEAGDTQRAINSFQQAVELKPKLLDGWLSLGALHEAIGNNDNIAERFYNTAVAVERENYIPYLMRADYFSRQDRLDEALAAYDEAIAIDPTRFEAFYNSGLVYLDMDSVDQAGEQFDRSIALRPVHPQSHYYRGVASELQGNVDAARRSYQQALNLSPRYGEATAALERLDVTL